MHYTAITRFFGCTLNDSAFKNFLKSIHCEPTEYNVAESDYIISKDAGIEIGFRNNTAEWDEDDRVVFKEGIAVFAFFNLYPVATGLVDVLPFDLSFADKRMEVLKKAGQALKTINQHHFLLNKHYLIDHYKINTIEISIEYHVQDESIEFIQFRNCKDIAASQNF